MKQIYIDGVKAKGCYHNGIKYSFEGNSQSAYIVGEVSANLTTSLSVSPSSTGAGKLIITPTLNDRGATTAMYSSPNLSSRLQSLPNDYRFVYRHNGTETIINTLSLSITNSSGGAYFSVSGDFGGIVNYGTKGAGKSDPNIYSESTISLEDSNGNLFYSDSPIFKCIMDDTTLTEDVSYIINTITYNKDNFVFSKETELTQNSIDWYDTATINSYKATAPSMYICCLRLAGTTESPNIWDNTTQTSILKYVIK